MFTLKFGITAMAVTFIGLGLYAIFFPAPMAIPHAAWRYGGPITEIISADTAQVYGFLSLLMGVGLLFLARKER